MHTVQNKKRSLPETDRPAPAIFQDTQLLIRSQPPAFPGKEEVFSAVVPLPPILRRSRYESYRDERSRHRAEMDPSAAIRLPIWPPALTAWGASAGRKPLPRLLAEAPQSDELGIVTAFGPEHVTITTRFLSSSLVAAAAANVVRREAQAAARGNWAARGAQRGLLRSHEFFGRAVCETMVGFQLGLGFQTIPACDTGEWHG